MRQDNRINLSMEVVLESRGKLKAKLCNLSMGGCFIDSSAHINTGETVVFKVLLPSGQAGMLNGEVVNVSPRLGFGLNFTVITEDEEHFLEQILNA